MKREDILNSAKLKVSGSERENSFATIANLWTAYKHETFTSQDVAMMMALLKIARIQCGYSVEESYVDLVGYAACAGELATSHGRYPFEKPGPPEYIELNFDDSEYAYDFIEKMRAILDRYCFISVKDVYDLAGSDVAVPKPGLEEVQNNAGWRSMIGIKVEALPLTANHAVRILIPWPTDTAAAEKTIKNDF